MPLRFLYKKLRAASPYLEGILNPLVTVYKCIPYAARRNKVSYSQWAEDTLLQSLLSRELGSYVDIGSGLPYWGSNTYKLYRMGWRGILVDPLPKNIVLSKILRRRDISICSAVGNTNKRVDVYEFKPYEYSTVKPEVYQNLINKSDVSFVRKRNIQMITLNELFSNLDFSKQVFLSIDAEGYEIEILEGNDWEKFKPNFICIEEWKNPINTQTPIRKLLESYQYRLEIYNGISSIYVLETY